MWMCAVNDAWMVSNVDVSTKRIKEQCLQMTNSCLSIKMAFDND